MMKKYGLFVFFIIVSLTVNLIAQPTLDIQITDPNPEVIYVSDLDILKLASANEFFEIAISNYEDQAYNNCILTLSFYKDDKLLAKIVSKRFIIPAQIGRRSANNVELMQDKFYLSDLPNPDHLIEVSESELITDEIDNLERDLLSSMKLPVGHYVLEGFLSGDNVDSQSDDYFDIINPSFIELIAPGGEAGSGFKEEVYTEYPLFQWNGTGNQYQVVVFEKKFALQSLDNVLNMNPNWQSDRLEKYNAQYPQVGDDGNFVIPLEFGKTYYWMVRMFVNTSAGEEIIDSEIWEFRLVDPTTLGDEQGAIARNQLIDFLRDLIGDKADELANQLGDYKVKSINVNGQDISLDDLYQLINQYRLKDVEVVDLVLPTGSY
jgi:hypothetical protein